MCDESILGSVKAMLGLDQDYNAFDIDILTDINSTFLILSQLGVGEKNHVFQITGYGEIWDDVGQAKLIPLIKSYMYLKVRLLFDPPNTGVLHEAMERQIKEFEWRINVEAETPSIEEVEGDG